MTARERVRAVLEHKLPDRIPNGLGGCETAGLHVQAYDKLQKVLGLRRVPPRIDTFMTNAVFELPVLDAMGAIFFCWIPHACALPPCGERAGKRNGRNRCFGKKPSAFRVPMNS